MKHKTAILEKNDKDDYELKLEKKLEILQDELNNYDFDQTLGPEIFFDCFIKAKKNGILLINVFILNVIIKQ